MAGSGADIAAEPPGAEPAGEATEEREVRVADPALSPGANARLTEEVQAIVGADHVTVTRRRAHPSRGGLVGQTGPR